MMSARNKRKKKNRAASLRHFPNSLWVLLLSVLGFLLYANTIGHEYVLDDLYVIQVNEFVQQGIEGIPEILTRPHWYAGMHYRPIPAISFALEHEIFQSNANIAHGINAVLYAVSCALLLVFFLGIKIGLFPALLATLLFTVHPVHTEVVANVKGRDELLAFLFLLGTLISLMGHTKQQSAASVVSPRRILIALLFFSLSLLCKESAVSFLAVVPISLYFFTDLKWKRILGITGWFVAITAVYIVSTAGFMGSLGEYTSNNSVVNNALLATESRLDQLATALSFIPVYIRLLIFPHPLVHDYGFNEIPVVSFASARVWFSILLLVALVGLAIPGIRRKSPASWAVLFSIIAISPSSNIAMLIGATMAERFLFIPSVGFCLILAWFAVKAIEMWPGKKMLVHGALGLVVVLFSVKTVARNTDWRDNLTLFSRDIQHAPNNASMHAALGNMLIIESQKVYDQQRRENMLSRAREALQKAVRIYPEYFYAHGNLGSAFKMIGKPDSAITHFLRSFELNPEDGVALMNIADIYMRQEKLDSAVVYFRKVLHIDPENANARVRMADCLALSGAYEKALVQYRSVAEGYHYPGLQERIAVVQKAVSEADSMNSASQ